MMNGSSDARFWVIFLLGKAGSAAKGVVPELIKILEDDTSKNKMEVADSLVKIDPTLNETIVFLIESLKDEDSGIRIRATRILEKAGSSAKEAIPALTELLKDEDYVVRSIARRALKKIRDNIE